MKALGILKAIEEQEDTHLWLDDGSGYPKKYIIEAIKELEDLENRSCDNCKKRPSPFSECPCWSYSFGKANISLCSEWEAKNENL